MEMPANPYEGRDNKSALEKKRDEYIQEELNLKAMPLSIFREITHVLRVDGEAAAMDTYTEFVLKRLKEKSLIKENSQDDEDSFDAEFPRELIREKIKEAGLLEWIKKELEKDALTAFKDIFVPDKDNKH